ncbi:DeoR/GlpR family DNA-binding transcription regulator [Enterococcus sp. AZ103]|uniref:DeoR/GlpR family DNA-binding transcription regulator n=1 Tax=Enterococcus sp. AZ103 TaxID=2774628 RepID=UPI003F28A092
MLKSERHQFILNKIETEGKVLVNDLTKELQLTEDTIRKDLQELAKLGLVQRVHGGALRLDNTNLPFEHRIDQHSTSKKLLAKEAVSLIAGKKVIYIDSGTTNLFFAESIPNTYNGIVITNSPTIALSLCNHEHVTINLLPGELDKHSKVLKGSSTLKSIEEINIELCLLGISSIDSDRGITVPSFEEAAIKKQLIKQSSYTIGIITKEKLGTTSTFRVGEANDLDTIVTEKGISKSLLAPYRDLGIDIQQV